MVNGSSKLLLSVELAPEDVQHRPA